MKIKEAELYKYLDILLLESDIAESNSSKNILHEKYLNPISSEEREEYFEICDGVISLGVKLGFFKYISKESDWYDLTEKGILAKSKGGYLKFVEYLEKKESESVKATIIAENYIGGNNHGVQASKSNIHKPRIQYSTNSKEKTSYLEKLSWIIGIIGGGILIYEFLIKKG